MQRRKRGQRGSVVRVRNSYFIMYRDTSGKQKMQGESPGHGFETSEEAQARLNKVLDEINRGDYVEPKRGTFGQFAEQWLQARMSIRGSTASAYASIIRKHLNPYLGDLPMHAIQDKVQALAASLAGKVSIKTLHNCMTLLGVMLAGKKGRSAIKLGYLRHDPTCGLELPTRERSDIVPPTTEQVWKLIDAAQELSSSSQAATVGHAIILLDAFTGLRRGEILALQYPDVDWFAGEILVSRAISKCRADDGAHKWRWNLGPTKNRRSRRVGLSQKVLRLLADLKQTATDPDGFIFTSEMAGVLADRHEFIDPDHFDSSIYRPIALGAELPNVRFHDLRHFFASMLIAQGESPKYVCDQMGHSSIQVTFDTYGHLFPQARREASAKLEEAMFAARGRKTPMLETLLETGQKNSPVAVGRKRAN